MALAKNSLEGRAEPFLARIENLIAEGESAKGEYLAECKERKSGIKDVYSEAKDAGISVKALKAVIKQRGLQKKIAELDAGLDIDDAAQFETLAAAFGDTPMGQYASGRAKGASGNGDDDRDLRGHQQRQTEKERGEDAGARADAEALSKVGRGHPVDDLAGEPVKH